MCTRSCTEKWGGNCLLCLLLATPLALGFWICLDLSVSVSNWYPFCVALLVNRSLCVNLMLTYAPSLLFCGQLFGVWRCVWTCWLQIRSVHWQWLLSHPQLAALHTVSYLLCYLVAHLSHHLHTHTRTHACTHTHHTHTTRMHTHTHTHAHAHTHTHTHSIHLPSFISYSAGCPWLCMQWACYWSSIRTIEWRKKRQISRPEVTLVLHEQQSGWKCSPTIPKCLIKVDVQKERDLISVIGPVH